MPVSESRLERLVYRWCFAAVVAGCGVFVLQVWRVAGADGLRRLGYLAGTSVVAVGKFVIFFALHEDANFSPWALALMVWLIDLVIAFSLFSGLEKLEGTFVLGGWLRRARRKAMAVLAEYPGLERMAFFGVVAYVLLPLAATGAVTGTFAARMVGLSRLAGVAAVAVGSLGTSLIFALLAQLLGEQAEALLQSPLLSGTLLLVLLLVGRLTWVRLRRRLKER